MDSETTSPTKVPWNKGKIVGQKAPLKLKDIWAIRIRLQLGHRTRELALFDLGLDSKLRACDLVRLRVRDICHCDRVSTRAFVMQQKTSQSVQFEITLPNREAVAEWIKEAELANDDSGFPAGSMNPHTWEPGGMRGYWIHRLRKSGGIQQPMALTPCVVPKRP